jgi:hypothetical protein
LNGLLMIHMELGLSTIVAIGLIGAGLFLYALRTKHPGAYRDIDLFFSSIGLLCGGILLFQGWRLDPILLLCQFLSSATAVFFVGQSLWLRDSNTATRINSMSDVHLHRSAGLASLEAQPSLLSVHASARCAQIRLLSRFSRITTASAYCYTVPMDSGAQSEYD